MRQTSRHTFFHSSFSNVRIVHFPGWQQTIVGDREVKQALRKTLLKYKLHQEQDLFDRAYEYIKQYY